MTSSDDDSRKSDELCTNRTRRIKIQNIFNYALTNARSLLPKIDSLVNYFEEYNLSACLISETWMRQDRDTDGILEEVENGAHISMIRRDRGRRGGGVAIAFDVRKMKLTKYRVNTRGFELVCATGKINNESRKLAVIAVYLPPKQTKNKTKEFCEVISDIIGKLKIELKDPYIILAGDINKKNIKPAFEEYTDIKQGPSLATRGGTALDLVFTNLGDPTKVRSRPPLNADSGPKSDHNVLVLHHRLSHRHNFRKITIKHRRITEEGVKNFNRNVTLVDWRGIEGDNPSETVNRVNSVLLKIMDKHLQWRSFVIKSTDKKWMTPKIRRLIKIRKRVFKNEGRSKTWKRLKKEIQKLIKIAKSEHFDKIKKLAHEANNPSSYFRAMKKMSSEETTKQWDIRNLFPGLSDAEIAEKVAVFFMRISDEFEPLEGPYVPTNNTVTPESRAEEAPKAYQISQKLKHMKKPKSQVEGDLPPELINPLADILAEPLEKIFRQVYEDLEWPRLWKVETVTTIPKNNAPEDMSELRNISCTPLFSKLLESFVLDRLRKETKLTDKHFGGLKGRGPDHFLALSWQEILSGLEDSRAAVVLTSIDFAKAFNRMSHAACLTALKEHGATELTIALVSAFLYQRTMSVKVGQSLSAPRHIRGGSPQGSILGSYLFCITTDFLDRDGRPTEVGSGQVEAVAEQEREVVNQEHNHVNQAATPDRIRRNRERVKGEVRQEIRVRDVDQLEHGWNDTTNMAKDQGSNQATTTSGNNGSSQEDTDEEEIRFFRFRRANSFDSTDDEQVERLEEDEIDFMMGRPERYESTVEKKFVYIDDYNCVEKVRQRDAIYDITGEGNRISRAHATKSERVFNTLVENAEEIGMKVNHKKTQMLCISAAKKKCIAHINTAAGDVIESTESLKLLGYAFNSQPTPRAHVDGVVRRMRKRMWMLRHLKVSGLTEEDILKAYTVYIRPLAEYAAPAFHSMLSSTMAANLESQQRNALKIIYGYNVSREELYVKSGLDTLAKRRDTLTLKFARKMAHNPDFREHFPKHKAVRNTRQQITYQEIHTRSTRLYNSPLFHMRRALNEEADRVRQDTGVHTTNRDNIALQGVLDEWR